MALLINLTTSSDAITNCHEAVQIIEELTFTTQKQTINKPTFPILLPERNSFLYYCLKGTVSYTTT